MFNTLTTVKKLEDAGVPRQQAEAQVQVLAEIVESELATKTALRELEYRLTIKLSAILGSMLSLFGVIIAFFK